MKKQWSMPLTQIEMWALSKMKSAKAGWKNDYSHS